MSKLSYENKINLYNDKKKGNKICKKNNMIIPKEKEEVERILM